VGQLPPGVARWLRLVFRTWGAFMAGLGVALAGIGGYVATTRKIFLSWGTAVAITVSFGTFMTSNLEIRSQSLPLVAVLFALAVVSGLALASELRT